MEIPFCSYVSPHPLQLIITFYSLWDLSGLVITTNQNIFLRTPKYQDKVVVESGKEQICIRRIAVRKQNTCFCYTIKSGVLTQEAICSKVPVTGIMAMQKNTGTCFRTGFVCFGRRDSGG